MPEPMKPPGMIAQFQFNGVDLDYDMQQALAVWRLPRPQFTGAWIGCRSRREPQSSEAVELAMQGANRHGLQVLFHQWLWAGWPSKLQSPSDLYSPAYYTACLARLHETCRSFRKSYGVTIKPTIYAEPHGDSIFAGAYPIMSADFSGVEGERIRAAVAEATRVVEPARYIYPGCSSREGSIAYRLFDLAERGLDNKAMTCTAPDQRSSADLLSGMPVLSMPIFYVTTDETTPARLQYGALTIDEFLAIDWAEWANVYNNGPLREAIIHADDGERMDVLKALGGADE